ncbi:MAG: hypothetical protein V4697_00915 [Patescibacteria group bacterium]
MSMTPLEDRLDYCEIQIEELTEAFHHIRGDIQTALGLRDASINHLRASLDELRKELNLPPKD